MQQQQKKKKEESQIPISAKYACYAYAGAFINAQQKNRENKIINYNFIQFQKWFELMVLFLMMFIIIFLLDSAMLNLVSLLLRRFLIDYVLEFL